jgi:hypothetical protein
MGYPGGLHRRAERTFTLEELGCRVCGLEWNEAEARDESPLLPASKEATSSFRPTRGPKAAKAGDSTVRLGSCLCKNTHAAAFVTRGMRQIEISLS